MLSFVGVYQPVLDQLADLDREVAPGGGGGGGPKSWAGPLDGIRRILLRVFLPA